MATLIVHIRCISCYLAYVYPGRGDTLWARPKEKSGTFRLAGTADGVFVGDDEGLTSTGSTFDPFFVMAKPIATKGPTGPFANTAG